MSHITPHQRKLHHVVFFLCALFFLGQGVRGEQVYWHSCDYVPLYAGARCMLGNCDPYSFPDVEQVYYRNGGQHTASLSERNQPLVNPPTTLLLAMPFSLFSFPVAKILWLAASGLAFCYAVYSVLAFVEWAPLATALGCLLMLTSPLLLMVGQSATLAIACISIATTLLLRGELLKFAFVLLVVSVALKPHLVGFLLIYLILRASYRTLALRALAAVVLFLLVSSLWMTLRPSSHHWFAEIRHTIAGSVAPGQINDPGPDNPDSLSMVNLQVDTSLFTDNPRLANVAAWLVSAVLIAGWLIGAIRPNPTGDDDMLAIASVSCISLLPIYHRLYDTRLMLLTIPAIMLLMKRQRLIGVVTAAVTSMVFLSTNHLYAQLCRRIDLLAGGSTVIPVSRLSPLLVGLVAATYVVVYTLRSKQVAPVRQPLGL